MPYGDGTGPMTGWASGRYTGYPVPGFMNLYGGCCRCCLGRGRGWRNWYWATGIPGWARTAMGLPAWGGWINPEWFSQEITPQKEAEILKKQAEFIENELKSINERIRILEKLAQEEKK